MTKRILAYMDYTSPSGFGSVSKNIIERLHDFLEKEDILLDICATNYGNGPNKVYLTNRILIFNTKFYATNLKDFWFRDGMLKILNSYEYDLLWIMNDLPVIQPLLAHFDRIKEIKKHNYHPKFKVLLYTPIDSPPCASWFQDFEKFDKVVTYTKHGQDEIKKITNRTVKIIPHGLDGNNFYKIRDKKGIRKKYGIPENVFVFGTVNKNQPRKDIGTTLIAFAKFKKNLNNNSKFIRQTKKDAVLYLHTYHSDPSGIDIHLTAQRLGLKYREDYFLPISPKYEDAEFTVEDMNEVYNCFDVFVTTSTAEGWGLTVTEAMCLGLPIIYGNHTSFKEILKGKSYCCTQITEHIQIYDGGAVRYKLNPEEVAEKMRSSYYLATTGKYGNLEVENYDSELIYYNWDEIVNSWKKVFKEML